MPTIEGWFGWALLSAAFAALTAIFAKLGLRDVDPDLAQLIRTAVVLVAMAALVAATGKWRPLSSLDGRTWQWLVLSGLATGASWLCYFRALHAGTASRVSAVDKLSVLLVALFAAMILGERLSAAGWVGVALVTVGIGLLSLSK